MGGKKRHNEEGQRRDEDAVSENTQSTGMRPEAEFWQRPLPRLQFFLFHLFQAVPGCSNLSQFVPLRLSADQIMAICLLLELHSKASFSAS